MCFRKHVVKMCTLTFLAFHCHSFISVGGSKIVGDNACGRCGKAVYEAEKIVGAGKASIVVCVCVCA